MHFLFTTLQTHESEFYGQVGVELRRLGDDVSHVTFSRASARALRGKGFDAWCLPDLMASLPPGPSSPEKPFDTPVYVLASWVCKREKARTRRRSPTVTIMWISRREATCLYVALSADGNGQPTGAVPV